MAFTYGQLKQTIQDFTENSETTFVNNIPTFIRLAEEKILQNVQLELFRKTQTANLATGNKYLNVPSDFLAPFSLSYAAIPWLFGTLPNSNTWDIGFGILSSYARITPYEAEWATAEAVAGRALGDVTGNGGIPNLFDSTAIQHYIEYKLGTRGNAGDADISYIEDSLIPYMIENYSTYGKYYDTSLLIGTTFMDFKDPSFLREYQNNEDTTGQPRYYALFDNGNFVISPTPDQDYSVQLSYFYRPQSITAGSDSGTTWLSTNAETTLLYASLIEANIFMKGEQDVTQSYMMRVSEGIKQIKMLGESKQTTDLYRTGQIVRAKE